jgi:NitT/TauT family transport system ATP-binding protein
VASVGADIIVLLEAAQARGGGDYFRLGRRATTAAALPIVYVGVHPPATAAAVRGLPRLRFSRRIGASAVRTAARRMYSIEVTQLSKRFAGATRPVLADLTFALPAGASLSLLGPSGCGKTTLLRLLMGLEATSGGSIALAPAARLSYVFQEPRLVPWRTALENVLLPLELTAQVDAPARERAAALLGELGLGERLRHFPRELSGGMQMRVALARALITEPQLLLLDEPFAALDERTRFRLQDLLLELKSRLALQYVFVTHSISEAVYLGDYILMLDDSGHRCDWRHVDFAQRNQALKLAPEFSAVAQQYSQRFAELENRASAAGARR